MSTVFRDLQLLEEKNETIGVGIIGAGQMGLGMASQLATVPGMRLVAICDHNLYKAENAANNYLACSNKERKVERPLATDNFKELVDNKEVDIVVEATGAIDGGAEIALYCLEAEKNMVLLNVELDITVGPILYKLFKEKGLKYTGSEGDEPAETYKLYEFAKAMGMEVLVIGKGKNNKIDYGSNPDTCKEEAEKKEMNPRMLASFKDGTKTMAEMNLLANATGYIPDIAGMHGVSGDLKETLSKLSLKDEGGVLDKYGVVEYVNGIAPGVFAIVKGQNEAVRNELNYMLQEEGDKHILYRPFHLGSLESTVTLAKSYLYGMEAIAPYKGSVCETVAVAKKDLKAGDRLDGMGGYCLRGFLEEHEVQKKNKHLPFGLVAGNTVCKRAIKEGSILTYDDVELDKTTFIYELRSKQDQELG